MEQFEARPGSEMTVRRIFVTLGTIRPYGFERLVRRLVSVVPENVEVVWQLGVTSGANLPGEVHDYMTSSDFHAAVESADVVISHAGIGTLLGLLEAGIFPIAVPREASQNEHVDDHQFQAAQELDGLGLVRYCRADEIAWSDILAASGVTVVVQSDVPPVHEG